MAKTNEQILRHLFNCRFSDDDWGKVLTYCHEHDYTGMHRAIRPKSASTYQQFVEWVKNGLGVGDVALYEGDYCVIGDELPGCSYIMALLKDGVLNIGNVTIQPGKLKRVSDDDARNFLGLCELRGYSVSASLSMMVKSKKLKAWESVKFNHREKTCYGVVKEHKDTLVDFVFVLVDGTVKKDFSVNYSDISTMPIKKDEISAMNEELARNGLRWDKREKQQMRECRMAELGETYWYISDIFSVRSGIERRSAVDSLRRKNGNYFNNAEDALMFLERLKALREGSDI